MAAEVAVAMSSISASVMLEGPQTMTSPRAKDHPVRAGLLAD
jgi:predicted phage tail protein